VATRPRERRLAGQLPDLRIAGDGGPNPPGLGSHRCAIARPTKSERILAQQMVVRFIAVKRLVFDSFVLYLVYSQGLTQEGMV
jgi:hypothetical protein